MAINKIGENKPAAPSDLTEQSESSPAIPSNLTEKAENTPAVPSNLTEQAENTPALPVNLAEKAEGVRAAPTNLTEEAEGSAAAPSNLTEKAEGVPSVPSNLTELSAGALAAPVDLTEKAASPLLRTLTPTLNFDFANGYYSINGNPKSLSDVATYTRASSATYTDCYVDEQNNKNYFLNTDYVGSVENLLTYSEQFDNAAWLKISGGAGSVPVVTPDAEIAPDGTKTADKIVFSCNGATGSDLSYVQQSITPTTELTGSVWLKSASGKTEVLDFRVGSTDDRISIHTYWKKFNFTSAASFDRIALIVKGNVDQTVELYAWRAQLTESAKPLPYVKTISSAVTQAFTESPRMEYDPATGQKGYLAEGGSTNLITYSEEFDNANWTKINSSVTANAAKAPDETFSADKLIPITTVDNRVNDTVSPISSGVFTFSCYAKKAENDEFGFNVDTGAFSNGVGVDFNLSTGIADTPTISGGQWTDASAKMTHFKDGWYRCELTATVNTTALTRVNIIDKTNSPSGTNGLFIWGAQLEQQPFATSYIRTEGSSVSRSADSMSLSSLGVYSQTEGAIAAKFQTFNLASNQIVLSVDDGSDSNRLELYVNVNANLSNFIKASGSIVANITGSQTITDGLPLSAAVTYSSGVELYADGSSIGSDAEIQAPLTTTVNIGVKYDSTSYLNGIINSITLYNKELTAQEASLL